MSVRSEAVTERALTSAVSRVEAWLPVDSIASPRREAQERLDRIAVGQLLQASVIAHMDDGSFMVDLSGMRIRMQLPAETRLGQKINLSLLSRSPQPSFQIEPDVQPNIQTTTTSLSAGARLIDSVLFAQREQDNPPAITSKLPVLHTPQTATPQIAQALRQTIEHSGLFYEAHVAAWANGQRPLAALALEPQQRRKLEVTSHTILPLGVDTSEDVSTGMRAELPPEMMQLVSAQIETLEHHRLVWQGEIWPGQTMVLETERQSNPAGDDTDDPQEVGSQRQAVWQTTLRLDLPEMGAITAHIHLIGERMRIDIEGRNPATVQTLSQQRQQLAHSMDAAGLGLIALSVSTSDQ